MELLASTGMAIITYAPHLVGFILPPFVEFLNRDVKNSNERFMVSLIVCFLVAVILHWNEIATGTPEQAIIFMGIIFTESQSIFKLYFNDSWMRQTIQEKIGSVNTIEGEVQDPIK